MYDRVQQRLFELAVQKFGVSQTSISNESSLQDVGGDSLDAVELLIAIEEEFDIDVPDEDAMQLSTFGDLVHRVCRAADRTGVQ
jgi:acyl carrier protein